eukprot:12762713-Heterocapsa_arctica.AAC.1
MWCGDSWKAWRAARRQHGIYPGGYILARSAMLSPRGRGPPSKLNEKIGSGGGWMEPFVRPGGCFERVWINDLMQHYAWE